MTETGWLEALGTRWWPSVDETLRAHVASDGVLESMLLEAWSAGGKRLRALLPIALAEALGEDARVVLGFAAACELIHNGTLVHDDLQDGDRLRRGKPAIWVTHGAAQAINTGSAMYVRGLQLVASGGAPADRVARAQGRLMQGLWDVIDGQAREFVVADREAPTWSAWHAIVERKTGALFAATLAGCAELLGCAPEVVEALHEAALAAGVVFQMQDDLLDLVADKGRERRGTDLAEGKVSAVVLAALDRLDAANGDRLRAILAAPRASTTDAMVDEAIALIEDVGAIEAVAQSLVDRRNAMVATSRETLPPEVAALVERMVDLFLGPVAHVLPR